MTGQFVRDLEREIEMADRAVALNPNSFDGWHCRGWVYRIAGLPEEAVRSFERAMRMSPLDPLLHRSLINRCSEESPSSEPLSCGRLPLSSICFRPSWTRR